MGFNMTKRPSGRWQYSLAALMIFVAIAAVVCAVAGLEPRDKTGIDLKTGIGSG
jgi:hypothetical protein